MKKSHYGIIGGVAIVAFGTFVLLTGRCYIIPCETEIEIISFEMPDHVYEVEMAQAEFTIKNKGGITAENCVLTWDLGAKKILSQTFQLAPSEEIDKAVSVIAPTRGLIKLGPTFISSKAWINCDNTESPKVLKDLIELKTR